MARGRLISKSLGSSRRYYRALLAGGKLGEFCQVLFPLIVANTDDFGRLEGDAFTVKNVVLPTSPRPERDFDQALDVLAEVGLVDRYTVNGDIYLQVNKFDQHQVNLHKRTESRFPESPEISGNFRSKRTEQKGTKENRTEGEQNQRIAVREHAADTLFDQFWAAYPKKRAKEAAQRAWNKRHPNDQVVAVMLRALERQKQSPDWQKESGRYIPHPETWLNGARWTDEPDVTAPAPVSDRTRQNIANMPAALQAIQERHRGPTS